MNFTYNLL